MARVNIEYMAILKRWLNCRQEKKKQRACSKNRGQQNWNFEQLHASCYSARLIQIK